MNRRKVESCNKTKDGNGRLALREDDVQRIERIIFRTVIIWWIPSNKL